jgi:hypothetical protein
MKSSAIRTRRLLAIGGIGALAAATTNTVIYAVGRAADVAYVVTDGRSGVESVNLSAVLSLTLMSFAIGLVAALVGNRFNRHSLRVLQVVGALLALATIGWDFGIDGTNAAKALLASMHIVVGIAYVVSLEVARTSPARSVRPAAATQLEALAAS